MGARHALTGVERTIAELRDYQGSALEKPRFNMFAIDPGDADERGSEG